MGWVRTMAPQLQPGAADLCASAVQRVLATDATFSGIFEGRILREDVHNPSRQAMRPRTVVFMHSIATVQRISQRERDQGTIGVAIEFDEMAFDLVPGEPGSATVADLACGLLLRNPTLQVDGGPVLAQSLSVPNIVAAPVVLEKDLRFMIIIDVKVIYRQSIASREIIPVWASGSANP